MKALFGVWVAGGVAVLMALINPMRQCTAMPQPVIHSWEHGHPRLPHPATLLTQTTPQSGFTPTSVYKREVMHGFTVLIHPAVLKQAQATRAMRQVLGSQLAAIKRVLPAKPLATLQKVRIWVEWATTESAATFHPSAEWLQQNGYNPDKADSVEISHTLHFVQWSQRDQPWMMLHELAHAYHHLVLGDRNASIQMAYQNAMKQGLYQSVNYVQGGQRKAYALVNEKEYFAELSEAYFGKNDFYPFTRIELKRYDPVGYQLMEQSWGKRFSAS